MYWTIVEIVYLLDVFIFAFLAFWFYGAYKRTAQGTKPVLKVMLILTTVLTLQETYFFINTAADPLKAALLPVALFGPISSIWIFAKLILTVAGAYAIYVLLKMHAHYAK